jgi:uncharacterized protein YlxW (UPF0749 family)
MPEDPDRAIGLLEQIADTALDDDYYVVRAGRYSQTREFNTVLTAVGIAMFALLVTLAVVQTRSDRPATERERDSLIANVDARKKLLASREKTAASLRAAVAKLRASADRTDPAYETLRLKTGDRAARGPGITITATPTSSDDPRDTSRITDNDLQILVNGLWYAGAEAISVNGRRIGTMSAIRTAGSGITVNYDPIGPPYIVVALGNKDTLESRFNDNPSGRYWAARVQALHVRNEVASSTQLTVPAVKVQRLTPIHAQAIEEE